MSTITDALNDWINRPAVPTGQCAHDRLEPLYRPTRPYPQPVTRTAGDTTLVATHCPSCRLLSWKPIEDVE